MTPHGGARVVQQDGAVVLELHGEIDALIAPPIAEGLPTLLQGARSVVLDLVAVTFLDSSGVRLVDRLARQCSQQSAPWRVVAPPAHVARRVLRIVGMLGPEVVEDRATALAQLAAER